MNIWKCTIVIWLSIYCMNSNTHKHCFYAHTLISDKVIVQNAGIMIVQATWEFVAKCYFSNLTFYWEKYSKMLSACLGIANLCSNWLYKLNYHQQIIKIQNCRMSSIFSALQVSFLKNLISLNLLLEKFLFELTWVFVASHIYCLTYITMLFS